MVTFSVDGQKVGTVEENPDLLARLVEAGHPIEFRAADGTPLGAFQRSVPGAFCPWEPTLTTEQARERIAEPGGMTLAEFRKQVSRA